MNTKNIFIKTLYIILISLTLFTSSVSASVIFEGSRVSGGIGYHVPGSGFDYSFGPTFGADSGSEQLQAFDGDIFNQITWQIKDYGVAIRSTMTAIPENSIAWVEAFFVFRVEGAPVNYSLEASVDMVNTRFMSYTEGGERECLSPGCDGDWLFAGKSTGFLSEGYTYVLEYTPTILSDYDQHSEFFFKVPEPPLLIILILASFAVIFRKKTIKNMNTNL